MRTEQRWEVIHGDALEIMRQMPDNFVDAIVTDPPYYKVKDLDWDHQWATGKDFLQWIDLLCQQWQRLLKPNGSLYCFASPQMAARVESVIADNFNVLNHLIWRKYTDLASNSGPWARASKDAMRSYFPQTERIIFAEHKGADNIAKGEAGYIAKCDELRGFVFEPLRAYLDGERQRAGVTPREVDQYTSTQMAGHWFTRVQWALPTAKHYAAIRELFNAQGSAQYLRREYEDLRREYEDLRREYEDLRRPFNATIDAPFTDVWDFPVVMSANRHPCEKPVNLLSHILHTSTRPDALILDCFAGSGSTGHAALLSDRRFVGIEKDAAWVFKASNRCKAIAAQEKLFAAIV